MFKLIPFDFGFIVEPRELYLYLYIPGKLFWLASLSGRDIKSQNAYLWRLEEGGTSLNPSRSESFDGLRNSIGYVWDPVDDNSQGNNK